MHRWPAQSDSSAGRGNRRPTPPNGSSNSAPGSASDAQPHDGRTVSSGSHSSTLHASILVPEAPSGPFGRSDSFRSLLHSSGSSSRTLQQPSPIPTPPSQTPTPPSQDPSPASSSFASVTAAHPASGRDANAGLVGTDAWPSPGKPPTGSSKAFNERSWSGEQLRIHQRDRSSHVDDTTPFAMPTLSMERSLERSRQASSSSIGSVGPSLLSASGDGSVYGYSGNGFTDPLCSPPIYTSASVRSINIGGLASPARSVSSTPMISPTVGGTSTSSSSGGGGGPVASRSPSKPTAALLARSSGSAANSSSRTIALLEERKWGDEEADAAAGDGRHSDSKVHIENILHASNGGQLIGGLHDCDHLLSLQYSPATSSASRQPGQRHWSQESNQHVIDGKQQEDGDGDGGGDRHHDHDRAVIVVTDEADEETSVMLPDSAGHTPLSGTSRVNSASNVAGIAVDHHHLHHQQQHNHNGGTGRPGAQQLPSTLQHHHIPARPSIPSPSPSASSGSRPRSRRNSGLNPNVAAAVAAANGIGFAGGGGGPSFSAYHSSISSGTLHSPTESMSSITTYYHQQHHQNGGLRPTASVSGIVITDATSYTIENYAEVTGSGSGTHTGVVPSNATTRSSTNASIARSHDDSSTDGSITASAGSASAAAASSSSSSMIVDMPQSLLPPVLTKTGGVAGHISALPAPVIVSNSVSASFVGDSSLYEALSFLMQPLPASLPRSSAAASAATASAAAPGIDAGGTSSTATAPQPRAHLDPAQPQHHRQQQAQALLFRGVLIVTDGDGSAESAPLYTLYYLPPQTPTTTAATATASVGSGGGNAASREHHHQPSPLLRSLTSGSNGSVGSAASSSMGGMVGLSRSSGPIRPTAAIMPTKSSTAGSASSQSSPLQPASSATSYGAGAVKLMVAQRTAASLGSSSPPCYILSLLDSDLDLASRSNSSASYTSSSNAIGRREDTVVARLRATASRDAFVLYDCGPRARPVVLTTPAAVSSPSSLDGGAANYLAVPSGTSSPAAARSVSPSGRGSAHGALTRSISSDDGNGQRTSGGNTFRKLLQSGKPQKKITRGRRASLIGLSRLVNLALGRDSGDGTDEEDEGLQGDGPATSSSSDGDDAAAADASDVYLDPRLQLAVISFQEPEQRSWGLAPSALEKLGLNPASAGPNKGRASGGRGSAAGALGAMAVAIPTVTAVSGASASAVASAHHQAKGSPAPSASLPQPQPSSSSSSSQHHQASAHTSIAATTTTIWPWQHTLPHGRTGETKQHDSYSSSRHDTGRGSGDAGGSGGGAASRNAVVSRPSGAAVTPAAPAALSSAPSSLVSSPYPTVTGWWWESGLPRELQIWRGEAFALGMCNMGRHMTVLAAAPLPPSPAPSSALRPNAPHPPPLSSSSSSVINAKRSASSRDIMRSMASSFGSSPAGGGSSSSSNNGAGTSGSNAHATSGTSRPASGRPRSGSHNHHNSHGNKEFGGDAAAGLSFGLVDVTEKGPTAILAAAAATGIAAPAAPSARPSQHPNILPQSMPPSSSSARPHTTGGGSSDADPRHSSSSSSLAPNQLHQQTQLAAASMLSVRQVSPHRYEITVAHPLSLAQAFAIAIARLEHGTAG